MISFITHAKPVNSIIKHAVFVKNWWVEKLLTIQNHDLHLLVLHTVPWKSEIQQESEETNGVGIGQVIPLIKLRIQNLYQWLDKNAKSKANTWEIYMQKYIKEPVAIIHSREINPSQVRPNVAAS